MTFCDLKNFSQGFSGIEVRIANPQTNLFTQRHNATNAILLDLFTIRRIQRYRGTTAHFHRLHPRQAFSPLGTDRFDDPRIAFFIGNGHWRRRHAAKIERHHLQFRKRAPHAVAIHQRNPQRRRQCNWHHRVHPASFHGKSPDELMACVLTQHFENPLELIAFRNLLHHHCRRAHNRRRTKIVIVANLDNIQQRHGAIFIDCFKCHQLT